LSQEDVDAFHLAVTKRKNKTRKTPAHPTTWESFPPTTTSQTIMRIYVTWRAVGEHFLSDYCLLMDIAEERIYLATGLDNVALLRRLIKCK
jgi:hypothetical protein